MTFFMNIYHFLTLPLLSGRSSEPLPMRLAYLYFLSYLRQLISSSSFSNLLLKLTIVFLTSLTKSPSVVLGSSVTILSIRSSWISQLTYISLRVHNSSLILARIQRKIIPFYRVRGMSFVSQGCTYWWRRRWDTVSRNTNILELRYKSYIRGSLGMVARKGTYYLSMILYASIERVVDSETYALKYLAKSQIYQYYL